MKQLPVFYGWVVLAVAFASQFLVYGIRNSFGVFYVPILEEFGWSRADTALIFSINLLIYGFMAPFSGALVDRFGPRRVLPVGLTLLVLGVVGSSFTSQIWHLYVWFGVVVSVGACLAGYPANLAVLSNWFVKRRGRAFGIFISGWSVSFIFLPLAQQLISMFGWRNAYLILGGTLLVILMPLILIFHRHRPSDMGLLPDGDVESGETNVAGSKTRLTSDSLVVDKEWVATDWNLRRALHTFRLWALFFVQLLVWGVAEHFLVTHQVAFAMDVGFTAMIAATTVSIFGIVAFSANLCGFLSDRLGRELVGSIGAAMFVFAFAVLILMREPSSIWMLFLYGVLHGAGAGLMGPAITATVADLFAGRNFGSINGFVVMGLGVGGVFGPWLGGFIFDLSQSYIIAFIVGMGAVALSCLLLWLASPRKVRLVPGRMPKTSN